MILNHRMNNKQRLSLSTALNVLNDQRYSGSLLLHTLKILYNLRGKQREKSLLLFIC